MGRVDIWDVSAVSCSFFVKDCCCQEKSSCASFHFLRIVLFYDISLGCSGTARPEESKSPHQTIDSHTLSPQIGKDCSKLGQTRLLHKLKQLAARFLYVFPVFYEFFSYFRFSWLQLILLLAVWPLLFLEATCYLYGCWCKDNRRTWCGTWFDPLSSYWSHTTCSHLLVMDKGISRVIWHNNRVQVLLERMSGRQPQDSSPGPMTFTGDADDTATICHWFLDPELWLGLLWGAEGFQIPWEGLQISWRWWSAIVTQLDVGEKSRDGICSLLGSPGEWGGALQYAVRFGMI